MALNLLCMVEEWSCGEVDYTAEWPLDGMSLADIRMRLSFSS